MFKQLKDLNKIRFPVYYLADKDWYRQDGLLLSSTGRLIDDKNMPGNSLGIRRLQSPIKDKQWLKKAYPDPYSMLTSKKNSFIDSNGVPFIYERTKTCKLIYHKINSLDKKGDHSILKLKDIRAPFKINRPPYGDARWARVAYLNGAPWFIYDFKTYKGKNSTCRV